jgi:hypothetical protein
MHQLAAVRVLGATCADPCRALQGGTREISRSVAATELRAGAMSESRPALRSKRTTSRADMTLLALDFVEANLAALMPPFSLGWKEQQGTLLR